MPLDVVVHVWTLIALCHASPPLTSADERDINRVVQELNEITAATDAAYERMSCQEKADKQQSLASEATASCIPSVLANVTASGPTVTVTTGP